MASAAKMESLHDLLRLWYHENCRVFQDRLVNNEDRDWFEDLMKNKMMETFQAKFEEVTPTEHLFYGDFMVPNVDNKVYAEVQDEKKVRVSGFLMYSDQLKNCFHS